MIYSPNGGAVESRVGSGDSQITPKTRQSAGIADNSLQERFDLRTQERSTERELVLSLSRWGKERRSLRTVRATRE